MSKSIFNWSEISILIGLTPRGLSRKRHSKKHKKTIEFVTEQEIYIKEWLRQNSKS